MIKTGLQNSALVQGPVPTQSLESPLGSSTGMIGGGHPPSGIVGQASGLPYSQVQYINQVCLLAVGTACSYYPNVVGPV